MTVKRAPLEIRQLSSVPQEPKQSPRPVRHHTGNARTSRAHKPCTVLHPRTHGPQALKATQHRQPNRQQHDLEIA